MKFDKRLAVELSVAFLRAQFRQFPERNPGELDWKHPLVAAARIKDGREMVFVGFVPKAGTVGASVIFEICKTTPFLTPHNAGISGDIPKQHGLFLAMHGTNVDYDSPCPEQYD